MKILKENIAVILLIIVLIVVVKLLESEPKTKVTTKTVYVDKIDTIIKVVYKDKPKDVFVEVGGGSDGTNVYRDKATPLTVEAKQYSTTLFSNNAKADLNITTTGELLDITGTIQWQEAVTTITKETTKPKSGLFIYAEHQITQPFSNSSIGLDYQIRNSIIVGVSLNYDSAQKVVSPSVKLGLPLF